MLKFKKVTLISLTLTIFLTIAINCGNNQNRCTGKGDCNACTDCSRCKHCNENEGMCGVCGDGEDEYFEP
jgi:hypothetical protein